MAASTDSDLSITGILSRSPEEIGRVLALLLGGGQTVRCDLAGGEIVFESKLLYVDPARAYILLDPGTNESATAALLARPRASFHANSKSWQVEFSAAGSQRAVHNGSPALRLDFPEILATRQNRVALRAALHPHEPLQFVSSHVAPDRESWRAA